MSSPSARKLPLANTRKNSGNKIMIRELEERFKGRRSSDLKLSDLSKVSPVSEEERRDSKTLSEKKHLINENMLQARARWMAQNRDRDDGATEDDTATSEKKDFVQSLEATKQFCIDANDKPDPDAVVMRSKRAYSNSYLSQSRVIPAPPKTRPPVIQKEVPAVVSPTGTDAGTPPASGQKVPQAEKPKQKAKKIFGIKIGKGKNTKQAKSGEKQNNGGKKKIGIKKALSENILIQRVVSTPDTEIAGSEGSLLPIETPKKGYQNVFCDPNFCPQWQQYRDDSRSNTNSPTDFTNKKPIPLPRKSTRNSLGSNNDQDSDRETLSPFSPRVVSPLQASSSNVTDSDCQTPLAITPRPPSDLKSPEGTQVPKESHHLSIQQIDRRNRSREDDFTSSVSSNGSTRQALGKTASLNPADTEWGPVATRRSTTRQKKLRRAICSEGDQDELDDDYIMMKSVGGSFVDRTNVRSMGPTVSITSTEKSDGGTDSGLTASGGLQALSVPSSGGTGASASTLVHKYQGLNIPTDKRLSNYYMKIISDELGANVRAPPAELSSDEGEESEEEIEFYGEVSKEEVKSQAPVTRRLKKENTVPLLNTHQEDDDDANLVTMSVPIHASAFSSKRNVKSATPPTKDSPTPPSDKTLTGRKFQYTEVTIDSTKKRVPSIPKKFKYQTVTMSSETGKSTIEEPLDNITNESPVTPKQQQMLFDLSDEEESDIEIDNIELPLFPKGSHPLLNLSSTSPAVGATVDQRSYYINRQSIIALESCKDLPSTMLSTVDPATGKVIWHEYVEIDDDQLDNMANAAGMAKSTPIPEKLSILLAVPPPSDGSDNQGKEQTSDKPDATQETVHTEEVVVSSKSQPEVSLSHSTSEESDDDDDDNTGQSLNSSMSSECNYIFNLNDPPVIPPRPENLDALVDQLKVRTSGDYAYAVIPEKHLFGKHWMKFKARNVTRPSAPRNTSRDGEKSQDSMPQQKSSATSKLTTQKLSPPSLPPKTHSLLREQELHTAHRVPEAYLMPIIVKTKKKKTQKSTVKQAKDKSLGTFISYIRDQISLAKSPEPPSNSKRLVSPPKPIPYKEHQKKKQQKTLSNLPSKVPIENIPISSATVGTRLQGPPRSPQRTPGNNRAHGRPVKSHKKLARQSYRGSHKIGSGQRRVAPSEGAAWNGRVPQGGVQKRRKPRGPRPEKLNGESLAIIMRSSRMLAEQISDSKTNEDGTSSKHEIPESEKWLTTNRGLSEIFVEISHLLKDSHCSEDDLMSAIESHFNLKVKKDAERREGNEEKLEDETNSTKTTEAEKVPANDETSKPTNKEPSSDGVNAKKTETKRPYVNLFFDDDDGDDEVKAGRIEQRFKEYKPPYVNLEFPENDSSSEDNDDYIEPSEAFASKDTPELSTSPTKSNRYFNPQNTPKICIDDRGNEVCPLTKQSHVIRSSASPPVKAVKCPAPTPRVRSKSSIISSSYGKALDDLQKRHEKTLSSNIPDTNETITSKMEESNLDFTSVTRRSEQVTRESSQKPQPGQLRTCESLGVIVQKQQPGQLRTCESLGAIAQKPQPGQLRTCESLGVIAQKPQPGQLRTCESLGVIAQKQQPGQLRTCESLSAIATSPGEENTSSYNLALELEERRFTKSLGASATRRVRLAGVKEEEDDRTGDDLKKQIRERSLSTSNKSLHRANALPNRRKQSGFATYSTGTGTFSHKGGRLLNAGSGVTIEVPENAIPKGQMQKLWFKVVQTVYDPSTDEELVQSLSDSGSFELESLLQEKKDKRVQLSPTVVVGPPDAVLAKPIVIRIPHCLPYRNNSWHLQMLGRASIGEPTEVDGEEEKWSEIMNTFGLVQPPPMKGNNGMYKKSAYQMHLDYVQIKTRQLGYFKLAGRPIRNGTYAAKKMVASVYCKPLPSKESLQFDIFVNNAIEDQSNALDASLTSHGHMPLVKNMPILCFGDGKDMEITLSNDSNTAIPLGTKAIPFGQFWRHNKVGQSHIIFDIETDLVEDDRTLTLRIQQAGSKLYHETNFILHDL